MNKLHIAYFLSEKREHLGGADQTLFMQAVLMSPNHDITVVLPRDEKGNYNSKFEKKCERFGLNYEILPYNTAFTMKAIDLVNCSRHTDAVEQFVLKEKIDILHSVQINLTVEYIARKHGIPHVMNIYSLQEWEWNVPYVDIFPQYISCDSEFFLNKWVRYLNCRGKCVRVFGDIEIEQKKNRDKELSIFGTAGTVCAYKNQLEIIKMVDKAVKKGKEIKLIIAGNTDQAYADECKKYIEEHHLQNNIQMQGFVEDMRSFFKEIDVYICGSKRESFPASVVEAVSCNIPIISTPVAGVPEILVHRQNAYIANGYSADALEEAAEDFWEDYEADRLGYVLRNENKTYRQYFAPKAVTKQITDLYDSMLSDSFKSRSMKEWCDTKEQLVQMTKSLTEAELSGEDMQRVHSRLLYFHLIRDRINAEQCYIWGAGRWGNITRVILEHFAPEIKIKAFIDTKRSGDFAGIEILRKEEMILQKDVAVFISFVEGQEEAVSYLKEHNMEILRNIFIIA